MMSRCPARPFAFRSFLVPLLACSYVCISAAPAGAHLVRPLVSSFQATGAETLVGVAVDQTTREVYVAGNTSANVERFTSKGAQDTSFAFASPEGYVPTAVAVDNSCYQHKPQSLTGPACAAFDPSNGDVYVAELAFRIGTVVKLDSAGKEVAGFIPITAGSIPPGSGPPLGPLHVAVDPSNGNVIVGEPAHNQVDIFTSSGAFISQFTTIPSGGVAVGSGDEIFTASLAGSGVQAWSPSDSYSSPTLIELGLASSIASVLSTGNLLVGISQPGSGQNIGEVVEHQPSGATLLSFGSGLAGEGVSGVAVDETTDTVYIVSTTGGESVHAFGAPVFLAEVLTGSPATGITNTAASVSGSVNPEGTTVTACRFEYGLSASYGSTHSCSVAPPLTGDAAIAQAASLEGLQPNETYHYRLVAVNGGGPSYGEDETFETPKPAPSIRNESVSALRQTSATLNAGINPNNQETTYRFEYGATTAYGTVLPVPNASIGTGYANIGVGQEISGLAPGTTYHFRAVATNAASETTAGPDQTFTTPSSQPPVLSTGGVSYLSQNTATLTGSVNTQGFETMYEFDLGVDTSYGSRLFGDAGVEPGAQTFTVALQGLQPSTTYHYRIVATNVFGTVYGADRTFTTAAVPSSTLGAPVSPLLVPAPALIATSIVSAKPKPKPKPKAKKRKKKKSSHAKGRK
jgi:hypothetical protein